MEPEIAEALRLSEEESQVRRRSQQTSVTPMLKPANEFDLHSD